MAVELHPSTELSHGDLAALFTAAYKGYFVPFVIDEATFGYMVDVFDLDLTRSLVAIEKGVPVGLASLGLRGTRSWLGGIGVIPSRRRKGIGEELTRSLLDNARAAGATEMVLEVILENRPAIVLYEKLGFTHTRKLELLSLPRDEQNGPVVAEDTPLDVARDLVRARRDGDEPWQREDETVDRLAGHDPKPQGIVAGDAAAVYRVTGETVSLVQAAGGERGLHTILTALRAKGTVSAVNYPEGGTVVEALDAAGAKVRLRQFEMVAQL